MKFLFFFVIVCAVFIGYSKQALTKDQKKEVFLKLIKEYSGKEGAAIGDLTEIFARKKPTGCVLACLGETIKMIKDNKVNVEEAVGLAKTAFDGDAAKVAKFQQLANDCAEVSDADRCEAAAKIFECGHNAAKKFGISFEDVQGN